MANGMALTQATSLWSNRTQLMGYDIMMMSCTGTDNDSHSTAQHENVSAYADAGGRIFGSHWHNGWINPENNPLAPPVVDFFVRRARLHQSHHRADRHDVPEGHGLLGMARERRRLDHGGTDRHQRRRTQRRRRDGRRAALDLRARRREEHADGAVLLVQHARRRHGVRPHGVQRRARLGGRGHGLRQGSVPDRVHLDHAEPTRARARVHVLRSLGVRAARLVHADPAAAAGSRSSAAARRWTAAASAASAAPPPPPVR